MAKKKPGRLSIEDKVALFKNLNNYNEIALDSMEMPIEILERGYLFYSPGSISASVTRSIQGIGGMIDTYERVSRKKLEKEEKRHISKVQSIAAEIAAELDQAVFSENQEKINQKYKRYITGVRDIREKFSDSGAESIIETKTIHELIRVLHQLGIKNAFKLPKAPTSKKRSMGDFHHTAAALYIIDIGGAIRKGAQDKYYNLSIEDVVNPQLAKIASIYSSIEKRNEGREDGNLFVSGKELLGSISLGAHAFEIVTSFESGQQMILIRYKDTSPGSYKYAGHRIKAFSQALLDLGFKSSTDRQFLKAHYYGENLESSIEKFGKLWTIAMSTKDLDVDESPIGKAYHFVVQSFKEGILNVEALAKFYVNVRKKMNNANSDKKMNILMDELKKSASKYSVTENEFAFAIRYTAMLLEREIKKELGKKALNEKMAGRFAALYAEIDKRGQDNYLKP